MKRTSLRLVAVAAAAVPALLTTTAPAHAGPDSFFSRTSGVAATAEWTQYFDFPQPEYGNVHVGYLNAFETRTGVASVWAWIQDFECPEGVFPGEHGEENGCEYTGTRQLFGEDVPFTVGRRASTATLKGSLTAVSGDPHSPDGPTTIGQVPADFTWTAVGDVERSRSTYRYSNEFGTFSETFATTGRDATLSGRLGPMLFEEAESASGRLEKFRSTSRQRG